jgi:rod shape-determining protein MreB
MLTTGLPKEFTISSEDTMDALMEPARVIADTVHDVLSRTPPELIGDISTDGIIMTGGGCLIFGFDRLIAARVGIHVYVADDAICCVARGTGAALDYIENLSGTKVNSPKKKFFGS